MPLPPATPRRALHARRIALQGFQRNDGLFDIEAHLVDTKADPFTAPTGRHVSAGEPVHDLWLRLVVDDALQVQEVQEVQASTDAAPHAICPEAPATLQALRGLRIGAGWSRAVAERLGGRQGCTHLVELLKPLATVAFQTLAPLRRQRPEPLDAEGRPRKIDSCYAYAADRAVVRQLWPMHFTGRADKP